MNNIVPVLLILICASYVFANDQNLEKEINLTLDKKAQIDLELSKTDESVKELEQFIRQKRKVLLQRSRALGYLKDFKWGAVMSYENPLVFERNIQILSRLNKYDFNLFKDYKSSIRNLAQGRTELAEYQSEIGQVIQELKEKEKQLQEQEQKRKTQLSQENKKSLLLLKGKLIPPTEGQLKLEFGSYRDQQNEYAFMIRGFVYEVKSQDKVYAVGPGKVIFRDLIPYWGETLIIQHDDDYYSVYAGLEKGNVKLEDTVFMKDIIGLTKKSNFYFELRHFENPINPKNWFKEIL